MQETPHEAMAGQPAPEESFCLIPTDVTLGRFHKTCRLIPLRKVIYIQKKSVFLIDFCTIIFTIYCKDFSLISLQITASRPQTPDFVPFSCYATAADIAPCHSTGDPMKHLGVNSSLFCTLAPHLTIFVYIVLVKQNN